jgi:hypothetical protein
VANKHNRKLKREEINNLRVEDVRKGDFFTLSPAKGYTGKQLRQAMQVMECWPSTMTVKCAGGCMDKPYDYFVKVDNVTEMDDIHKSDYFEDNRKREEVTNG